MTYNRRAGATDEIDRPNNLLSDLGHAMSVFQVHPSWFDDYWLKPPPARPPHLAKRMIRGTVALCRRAPAKAQAFVEEAKSPGIAKVAIERVGLRGVVATPPSH